MSYQVWQQRWQALDDILARMVEYYAKSDFPRHQTIHSLAECLRAFTASQFNFFYKGFGDGEEILLEPSAFFPPEYIFRQTLDQATRDMAVIRWASQQREVSTSRMKEVLALGDKLGQAALQPAIDQDLVGDATVITYFEKQGGIRVIPYAPVALVALPLTATRVDSDLLATPHEVGHYVLRHAHRIASDLGQKIPLYPDWRRTWFEEIFADIYGCLIAGPAAALAFQDILQDNNVKDFSTDDGVHPAPLVRPYLFINVLNKMGHERAAQWLNKRWDDIRYIRGNPTFTPNKAHEDRGVAAVEADSLLADATNTVATYLQQALGSSISTPWTPDLPAKAPANSESWINKQFSKFQKNLPAIIVPELLGTDDDRPNVGLTRDEVPPTNNTITTESADPWLDAIKTSASNGIRLPSRIWFPVFTTGGWITAGPEENYPPFP